MKNIIKINYKKNLIFKTTYSVWEVLFMFTAKAKTSAVEMGDT